MKDVVLLLFVTLLSSFSISIKIDKRADKNLLKEPIQEINIPNGKISERCSQKRVSKLLNKEEEFLWGYEAVVKVTDTIKKLKLGDKVPDIELGKIVGHPKLEKARISDFKGTLLILDFWSTWCSVCISLFPKMEELQKEYGEKITVLPVGFDANSPGDIMKYLKAKKGTPNELRLPCLIQGKEDSNLLKLFPFSGLPHEIWIDSSGTLIGITDHLAVNSKNVKRLLNGEKLNFSIKTITKGHLRRDERLLLPIPNSFGSAITGYIDTFSTGDPSAIYLKNDSVLSYYGINRSVYSYYRFFYKDSVNDLTNKKIIVEPLGIPFYKDKMDMKGADNWSYDEFKKSSLFTYEIAYPAKFGKSVMNKFMIEDFDRFFQIESKIEKRKIKAFAVVKSKRSSLSTSKNLESKDRSASTINGMTVRDNSIDAFVSKLNHIVDTPFPIINKVNSSEIFSFIFPIRSNYTIEFVKMELLKHGLDLIETIENLDVLILKRAL